jgi:hypothetical protein
MSYLLILFISLVIGIVAYRETVKIVEKYAIDGTGGRFSLSIQSRKGMCLYTYPIFLIY